MCSIPDDDVNSSVLLAHLHSLKSTPTQEATHDHAFRSTGQVTFSLDGRDITLETAGITLISSTSPVTLSVAAV